MKESEFKNIIRQLVREIIEEEDLEEITTTGNIAGYNTPNAFKKTDGTDEDDESDGDHIDNANQQTGYRRVDERVTMITVNDIKSDTDIWKVNDLLDRHGIDNGLSASGNGRFIVNDRDAKKARTLLKKNGYTLNEVKLPIDVSGKEVANRWHELKKSDKTPNQKIGIGIRNIRYELQEMNKFLNWYNKIRLENELPKDKYWKRTQRHIKKLKENMISMVRKIQEIDKSLDEIE